MFLREDLLSSPVFICGHPKSGTSLILTLFDSHPELVVYPEETHYFRRFLPRLHSSSKEDVLTLGEQYLIHIFKWDSDNPAVNQAGFADRNYSHIEYQEIRIAFEKILDTYGYSSQTILPAAILAYGQVAGQLSNITKYWIEKTPYNEGFTDTIFSLWPEAKCVHVVRDPRDNYSSYHRKHPNWSVAQFARSWLVSYRLGELNKQRFGNSRYLVMRYEDLVNSIDESLLRIINFLGIDDSPSLRIPTRSGVTWGGNSMFGDKFSAVSTRPAGRYRETLSEKTVQQLDALLFPEIKQLKYDLDKPVPLIGWLRGYSQRMKWRIRRQLPGL
jgi:hypothetical protein